MKTIEEAAHEYFREGQLGFKPAANTEAAFIAGIKFAQRWISVEDELPEKHKSVLVKDRGGYIFVAELSVFGWLDTQKQQYCESYRTIVYWRPIELK
ncbi:MAG: DUF551 domain-containing protein [Prevotellaceae bacterium]|jgi:hypothetical protein|nr:DUF551 domain-containing protein [Prevotellaceae bacterium]